MPTTREQLDAALTDLKALVAEVDQKHRPSDDDNHRLNQQSAKVGALVAAVKADNLSRPAQSGFDYSGLASAFTDTEAATRSGPETFGAPSLDITEKTVRDLHTAALGRHVLVKAAVDSAEAPMSLAGDYRTNSVFPWLLDKPRLLSFIPTERTDAPTVHYYRATAGATAAAAVAEGANKPESSPVWEQVDAQVRKLAHYTRVNDEVLADFTNFRDVIGQEMLAGLIDEENDQLLNGTGVAPNLRGLSQTVGIQTIGSAGTDLDAVAEAMNKVRTATFLEPDIIIMHPNDWSSTGSLLAKDSTGQYLVGNPHSTTGPSLWGVPVLLTTRQTENTVMVANLKQAAKVYVRQAPVVEVAPMGGGTAEFIANQTLVRAEERLALTVVRPAAICTVTAV